MKKYFSEPLIIAYILILLLTVSLFVTLVRVGSLKEKLRILHQSNHTALTLLTQQEDDCGLISITYTDDRDTFALDYLTQYQMDSVFDITYVPYFNKCQILEPDYVCSDTLMVIDHKGLNHAMAYYEQGHLDIGDYGLDSIMHTFCVPYSKTSGLQPVNFDTQ